jgi:hypothetical protein
MSREYRTGLSSAENKPAHSLTLLLSAVFGSAPIDGGGRGVVFAPEVTSINTGKSTQRATVHQKFTRL